MIKTHTHTPEMLFSGAIAAKGLAQGSRLCYRLINLTWTITGDGRKENIAPPDSEVTAFVNS